MNPEFGKPRSARGNLLWLLVLIAVMGAIAVVGRSGGSLFKPSRETAVVEVFREASPAVVNITATPLVSATGMNPRGGPPSFEELYRQFWGGARGNEDPNNYGSGIIVDPRGYILTNEHVVVNTASLVITLADGRTVTGEVWGSEPSLDIAVVKIETKDPLPYLEKGRSDDLMIGEPVIVIGNPIALGRTCGTGIISSLNRFLEDKNTGRVYRDLIQIDAAVNPGNSGGPLLNIRGELIGITAYKPQQAQVGGIGFAIPIDKAWAVVDDLIRFRYVPTGWLGVSVEDLALAGGAFNVPLGAGVFVAEVAPDSPAARSLQAGDILETMDGVTIHDLPDFVDRARGLRLDQAVKLSYVREGQRHELKLTAGAFPEALAEEWAWYHLGLKVEEGQFQVMGADGRTITIQGVFIQNLAPGSPAQALGFTPGDMVRRLNNVEVKNREDFRKAVAQLRGREAIFIRGQRGRMTMSVALPCRESGERW